MIAVGRHGGASSKKATTGRRWLVAGTVLATMHCLSASASRADTWHAVYDTYIAGANAVQLTAAFRMDQVGYRIDVRARTLGLVDVFVGSRQSTQVDGVWHGAQARPRQFRAEGVWKGERRVTHIDYENGLPRVRDLIPPEQNREIVPSAAQLNSLDRVSTLIALARQIARTGACDAAATTYDGRRLEEARARTVGWEDLPPVSMQGFVGKALRCDVEFRMTAGFTADEDRAHAGRIRHAKVWAASPRAGAPVMPIRISIEVGWLGSATVYLSDLRQVTP